MAELALIGTLFFYWLGVCCTASMLPRGAWRYDPIGSVLACVLFPLYWLLDWSIREGKKWL